MCCYISSVLGQRPVLLIRVFFIRAFKYISFRIFDTSLEFSLDVSPRLSITVALLLLFHGTSIGPVVPVASCYIPTFNFLRDPLCGVLYFCWFHFFLVLSLTVFMDSFLLVL